MANAAGTEHQTFINEWIGTRQDQFDCLLFAVQNNNCEMLQYLLNSVKLPQDLLSMEIDSAGRGHIIERSILHEAAKVGNGRIIFELCGDEVGCLGMDVNRTDKEGYTPLIVAT